MVHAFCKIFIVFIFAGCFYVGADDYEAVLDRPSSQWTSRDRMTVIAGASRSNLHDKGTNFGVVVIPYYPSVITALGRTMQAKQKLSEDEYGKSIGLMLTDDTLSSVVREHERLLDEKGNYHRDLLEVDSLMFYVSLTNRAWPCSSPLIGNGNSVMRPLFRFPGDVPCPEPDITNLVANVYLVNDQNLKLHPRWIWGRKHERLTSDETLLFLFQFRSGEYHFLKKSKSALKMVIDGFEHEIVLEFPVSHIR